MVERSIHLHMWCTSTRRSSAYTWRRSHCNHDIHWAPSRDEAPLTERWPQKPEGSASDHWDPLAVEHQQDLTKTYSTDWNRSNHIQVIINYIYIYIYIYIRIFVSIERSKDQHLYEIKIFCNIIHYTIQKLGVCIICWGGGVIEINICIQQGCFKLIKSDDRDIYNVTKDFYFREMLLNQKNSTQLLSK